MIQFLLVLLSILYGFLYSLTSNLFKKNLILFSIYTILATFLYVFILYKLYNGNITILLKLSLILGYILCKVTIKNVKFKKHI